MILPLGVPAQSTAASKAPANGKLRVSQVRVDSGGKLDVEISGEGIDNLLAITDLRLAYDPVYLALPDASRVELLTPLDNGFQAINPDVSGGLIRISWAGVMAVDLNGPIITIAFDLKPSSSSFKTTLDLVSVGLEDGAGHPIAVDLIDGQWSNNTAVRDWTLYG